MSLEMRTASFQVNQSHPDFLVACDQAGQARRLGNTLNFISRLVYGQRADNYNHNKTTKDASKLIDNPHTFLDPLYHDTRLLEIPGVVPWLQENSFCNFTHKFNFAPLIRLVSTHYGLTLNTKVAQSVGMKLAESYSSYNALLGLFYQDPEHNQKPSLPGYKQTYGYVEYTKQALKYGQRSLTDQHEVTQIIPTGWKEGFLLPGHLKLSDIRSVRLIPVHSKAFTLEAVYQVGVPDTRWGELDDGQTLAELRRLDQAGTLPLVASCDVGQNILGAFVFSDGRTPILLNGKPLKAINQHANKDNAKLRSIHDTERENVYRKNKLVAYHNETPIDPYPYPISSQALDRLWQSRNDQINLYLHTASSRVVRMLVSAGVEVLLVGWNKRFKDGISLGGKNNQNFAQIPHARFRDMLAYKCRAVGIRVIVVEESYTSKASFLDSDVIPTYGTSGCEGWKPSGRRIERGLYKSATGILIHADVNGAYNILAKHVTRVPLNLVVTCKDAVVHPVWLEMPGLSHKPDITDPQTRQTLSAAL